MAKRNERKRQGHKAGSKSGGQPKYSKKRPLMRRRPTRAKRGVIGGKRSTLAYCVRCRRKTASCDQKKVMLRNNRCALRGNCGLCNTPKYMIISKAEMDSGRIWTNAERCQQRMVK